MVFIKGKDIKISKRKSVWLKDEFIFRELSLN